MTEEDNDLDLLTEDPLDRLLASDIELVEDPQVLTKEGSPINLGIGMPTPTPSASEDTMVCMRGPCKYYLEIPAHFAAGNIGDHVFKMTNRFCLKVTPNEDLTDSLVYDCNHWDPITPTELLKRTKKREKWVKDNKKEKW